LVTEIPRIVPGGVCPVRKTEELPH
jgi:hypothetical protein